MPMRFEHSLVKSADLESTLFMESTWREINENKNLSNTEIHIQESIWEIFATERSYMKGLKLKICFFYFSRSMILFLQLTFRSHSMKAQPF